MIDAQHDEIISSAAALAPRSLESMLKALVDLVAPLFDVGRASVRVLHGEGLRIAALWSAGPTTLRAGMTMSRFASSLPEIVRTGAPLSSSGDTPSLLDDILYTEGIRSWISIPITSGEHTIALLSFSSTLDGTFDARSVGFFERLGAAVEGQIAHLLARTD